MIINEAYYTVQEGTASRDDIDKAMKGTTQQRNEQMELLSSRSMPSELPNLQE